MTIRVFLINGKIKISMYFLIFFLEFYATGGLLTVNTDMPPILPAWFQAAAELGYPTGDPNGNQTESETQ